jgi:drug/metabolite transporter (DMT)-like permease
VEAVNYALTLVAALLLGVGFVLQQHAAEQAPEAHFLTLKLIGDLFRKRLWLAGIGTMIAGQILAAWSIGNLELSIVEPLLTTNLLFALILAVPLSHQAVRVTEVAGALVLIAGEGLLELARSAQPIGQSFGSFSHWPLAAVVAFIAAAVVLAGRHRSGRYRAPLTGLAAGLVFGIQDALTRQTLQILKYHGVSGLLHSWSAYCLVATGAVGVLLMQNAFSAGPLHRSLPTITAGEPVVGILLGIAVFGDRVSLTPASLAMQAAGLFALVVGVVLVARAPALSNLRKVVTEPVHIPHPHLPSHRRPDAVAGGGRPEQPVSADAALSPLTPDPATSGPAAPAVAGPTASLTLDAPDPLGPAAPSLRRPAAPLTPVSPAGPVDPPDTGTGNGNSNGNGSHGLMAPAQPPRAVPPEEPLPAPLETREIAEF